MSIDDYVHFMPEEYAKCIKCVREYRPDIYNTLNSSLHHIEHFDREMKYYTMKFYTDLLNYKQDLNNMKRDIPGFMICHDDCDRVFSMYDAIFQRMLEL